MPSSLEVVFVLGEIAFLAASIGTTSLRKLRVRSKKALCSFILRGGLVGYRAEPVADPVQGCRLGGWRAPGMTGPESHSA
jgi:hypothetical protein